MKNIIQFYKKTGIKDGFTMIEMVVTLMVYMGIILMLIYLMSFLHTNTRKMYDLKVESYLTKTMNDASSKMVCYYNEKDKSGVNAGKYEDRKILIVNKNDTEQEKRFCQELANQITDINVQLKITDYQGNPESFLITKTPFKEGYIYKMYTIIPYYNTDSDKKLQYEELFINSLGVYGNIDISNENSIQGIIDELISPIKDIRDKMQFNFRRLSFDFIGDGDTYEDSNIPGIYKYKYNYMVIKLYAEPLDGYTYNIYLGYGNY